MDATHLIGRTQALGGFGDAAAAERALEVTLGALGEALLPEERRAFREALPTRLHPFLDASGALVDGDLTTFYSSIARRQGLRPGAAREEAQVACRALAELSPPEAISRLKRGLPRLAALFELPGPPPPPPVAPESTKRPDDLAAWAHLASRTLAGGRPGSHHPLSDARPDHAHTHSVARSDDPHADTKLSSAHGSTQVREHETLAEGKPGPKRSLGS